MSAYDLAGKIIGPYELLEPLGVGGMSTVYRAYQISLKRHVAIKILPASLTQQPGYVERFTREAETAAALEHPHIVPIIDYGTEEGMSFLVMRMMVGGTLSERLKRQNGEPLPSLQEVVTMLNQLADALEYAHSRGVVHRDIKPSNVAFDDHGNAYLTDFGIAKLLMDVTSLTQTGSTMGTPAYMPPEQWQGLPVTPATDQYALGILVYELLTGHPPFEGDTPASLMYRHLTEPPPLPSQIPQPLGEVVLRALAKGPEDRFPSVTAFAQAFAEAAGMLPSLGTGFFHTASPTIPPSTGEWARATVPPPLPVQAAPGMHAQRRAVPAIIPSAIRAVAAFAAGTASALGEILKKHRDTALTLMLLFAAALVAIVVLKQDGLTAVAVVAVVLLALEGIRRYMRLRPVKAVGEKVTGKDNDAAPMPVEEKQAFNSTILENSDDELPPYLNVGPALDIDATYMGEIESHAPLPEVQLMVIDSPVFHLRGRSFKITQSPFSIGRSSTDVDLSLTEDSSVSRRHADIIFDQGGYFVLDKESSNGTYVNGLRLGPGMRVPLFFGSQITIGKTTLAFAYEKGLGIPDLVGNVISDRYEISEQLKMSGKAAVYKAYDRRLKYDVALKALSPDLASNPGYMGQFNREAETAARLKHPNIVKIHDHGTDPLKSESGGSMPLNYIVMELLGGGTLAERFAEEKYPSLEEITGWVDRLSDALDYAHRQGVIHSGIKPSAVVFDDEGKPFLTDFAIATRIGGAGHNAVMGAPAFIAPEQWEGQQVSPATDQYALGVLVYLMLTAERPFEGQENPEIRKKNFAKGVPPAHRVAAQNGRPAIPDKVSEVLAKALSIRPEDRYSSVSEFATQFTHALKTGKKSTQPQVFISYQRGPSAGWATLFAKELREKHGITAFVDTRALDGATRFPKRLENGIQNCDVFVCFLAETTLNSKWVQEEIRLAHTMDKPMIPVFQESFKHPDVEPLEDHLDTLLQHDGVYLLDQRNIHVDYTIGELAEMILLTLEPKP